MLLTWLDLHLHLDWKHPAGRRGRAPMCCRLGAQIRLTSPSSSRGSVTWLPGCTPASGLSFDQKFEGSNWACLLLCFSKVGSPWHRVCTQRRPVGDGQWVSRASLLAASSGLGDAALLTRGAGGRSRPACRQGLAELTAVGTGARSAGHAAWGGCAEGSRASPAGFPRPPASSHWWFDPASSGSSPPPTPAEAPCRRLSNRVSPGPQLGRRPPPQARDTGRAALPPSAPAPCSVRPARPWTPGPQGPSSAPVPAPWTLRPDTGRGRRPEKRRLRPSVARHLNACRRLSKVWGAAASIFTLSGAGGWRCAY
ncbi:PREDICTED: subtilisin-like protease 1 isoform X1 [Condylura cristata]|uniref:subtilisin-like protease 1 isoform X1 n=1 Tax=Condylura cristata TaxID=143302 RepID=UPI0006431AE9|nr:PREDICTED: subtilisin-like protease 1 isoform X1 [Condylura cristata]